MCQAVTILNLKHVGLNPFIIFHCKDKNQWAFRLQVWQDRLFENVNVRLTFSMLISKRHHPHKGSVLKHLDDHIYENWLKDNHCHYELHYLPGQERFSQKILLKATPLANISPSNNGHWSFSSSILLTTTNNKAKKNP